MHANTLFGLAATVAYADALSRGFNYGSSASDGSPVTQSQFQDMFQRAQNLPGTDPFTSARLYTMIQGGTTNSPIEAIPAAMATGTELLLGMWTSAGQDVFNNELAALSSAIQQYGTKFTNLVTAISVGSEDLYRNSVTGASNQAGIGVDPDVIVGYIQQLKKMLADTSLNGVSIGHVDTWDAWANGTNADVINNVDWLGVDSYPYFEKQVTNPIQDSKSVFYDSINNVKAVAGGKEVWVTETGWPVSGPQSGQAEASVKNAEYYWQQVGCELFSNTNTWWYTITDSLPTTPSPSFGIIGSDLQSAPLYDLTCKAKSPTSSAAASLTKGSNSRTTSAATSTSGWNSGKGPQGSKTSILSGKITNVANATSTIASASVSASATSAYPSGVSSVAVSATTLATTGIPATSAPLSSPTAVPVNAAAHVGAALGAGFVAVLGMLVAL